MRHRLPRLARMRTRTFVALAGAILVVCVGVGAAMRTSLTDYGVAGGGLMELDYVPSPSTEGMLRLYTDDEVVASAEEMGVDTSQSTLDELQDIVVMAIDNVENMSSLVVVGTFNGSRDYAYRTFRCQVEVSRVIKGEGVTPGDTIAVFDPFMIVEPDSSPDTGYFSSERVVRGAPSGYGAGMTPMREGQEYLLFLVPKEYPPEWDDESYVQTYELVHHPYARIATDVCTTSERVGVIDMDELPTVGYEWGELVVMPRYPMLEACQYDIYVQSEEIKQLYLSTCGSILERVL